MGLQPLEIVQLFQCGDGLCTSESDVNRSQILTRKDGPHAETLILFLIHLKLGIAVN